MKPEELWQSVRQEFAYLSEEFGFAEDRRVSTAPEAFVKMRNDTTSVTVAFELGSRPWVKISRLGKYRDRLVDKEGYDLSFLLEERDPAALARMKEESSEPDLLHLQAHYLRKFGADLLQGDFSVFPALRSRAEKALEIAEQQLYRS